MSEIVKGKIGDCSDVTIWSQVAGMVDGTKVTETTASLSKGVRKRIDIKIPGFYRDVSINIFDDNREAETVFDGDDKRAKRWENWEKLVREYAVESFRRIAEENSRSLSDVHEETLNGETVSVFYVEY